MLKGLAPPAMHNHPERTIAQPLVWRPEASGVPTHGHGGDSDAAVHVTVGIDGDRVVLVYEDDAPPFDPFARVEPPDAEATVEARDVGRLGVFLITQVAARCRYERTGDRNCITVELPVAQRSPDARSTS
jgi:anti-sigma regulatory factor (Ser/Thr protein kinase)